MSPLFLTTRVPRKPAKKITLCTVLLTLLSLFTSFQALAWTPGLKEAAEAVARGSASAEQQMLVFLKNEEINLMGIKGTIPKDIYATCQTNFESLNTKFATKAVEEAGFKTDFKQRSAQAKINPGTDTDVNFRAPAGKKIGLEDLKQIENNYQRIARQHFEDQKLNVPEGRINTDTDFLPDPGQMSPGEFKKCAQHINANGGTAYQSPEAVSAQMKLDGKSTAPVEMDEAIALSTEGKAMARHKLAEAKVLRQDAAAIYKANPGLAEKLEAQAQLYESQASKYVSRIEDVNNKLLQANRPPELPKNSAIDSEKVFQGLDKARDNIKTLNRGTQTAKDASSMRTLDEQLLQKATDQTIDTLAEIAKLDPMKANQARRAIAAELNSLPPAKAAEALKRLEQTVGPNFTKSIANESRRLAQIAKPATRTIEEAGLSAADRAVDKFSKVGVKALKIGIIAGGAYFMGKDGVYHALEQTEANDTELDFFYKVYKNAAWYGTGIGYAYEEAEKEELARYMREVEAGRDPGMSKHVIFTILKTPYLMARDITVGILYAPDALIEAITGTKEAEAKERAAKEFLAAVRLAVLNKKETEKAKDLAKEMGVHPEDEKAFLNCMCRSCGGSLGGFYNPACTSDIGHGPCQCNGPLTIWKTPLPTGSKDLQYTCFNNVTKMRYNEAQAIFDKWRKRMRDENFNSAREDVAAVKKHIAQGEYVEAADRFKGIKDLIDGYMVPDPGDGTSRNLSYELSARITDGLLQQARENAADPNLAKPLAQSVRKATKAQEVNPSNEEIKKQLDQYKKWEKLWNEVIAKDVPEIKGLINKGLIKTATERFGQVQMGINQGQLPPRHKDQQMVALDELLRQKRQPGAYTVRISHPMAEAPRPTIWQCRTPDNCAMARVAPDTYVAREKLSFQADISPRVPDVKYAWQVTPVPPNDLHCQSQPKANQMSMRCPVAAKYLVSVRAQSADGSILGHGSQQVVIAINADEVAKAKEQQQAYEAKRQKATVQLKLAAGQGEPGEMVTLKWSTEGNVSDKDWIGLIPSAIPHGKVAINDAHDLGYQYIGKVRSGTMQFTAPATQGDYDLRFNSPGSGKELASVTFRVRKNTAATSIATSTTSSSKPARPVTTAQTAPAKKGATGAQPKAYGSAAPLAGMWQVRLNGWPGTLTIGGDGNAVLRLPTKEEPLKDVGYKAATTEVTFTRPIFGGAHKQVYTGIVSGNAAKGTFDCTATGKGQRWEMTRKGEQHPAASEVTEKERAPSPPNGWKQITLGYLQFVIPASLQHKTNTESWVQTHHIYWRGNFDNPDYGITCGVVTNYNRAKEEMGSGSTTTIAGIPVVRAIDGNSETLLFPPKAGTQGVVIMFFTSSGSTAPKADIIKSIRAMR
ncbi:MAG: hypothetical protein AB7U29_14060 [Desulfobulbus sp.]